MSLLSFFSKGVSSLEMTLESFSSISLLLRWFVTPLMPTCSLSQLFWKYPLKSIHMTLPRILSCAEPRECSLLRISDKHKLPSRGGSGVWQGQRKKACYSGVSQFLLAVHSFFSLSYVSNKKKVKFIVIVILIVTLFPRTIIWLEDGTMFTFVHVICCSLLFKMVVVSFVLSSSECCRSYCSIVNLLYLLSCQ